MAIVCRHDLAKTSCGISAVSFSHPAAGTGSMPLIRPVDHFPDDLLKAGLVGLHEGHSFNLTLSKRATFLPL